MGKLLNTKPLGCNSNDEASLKYMLGSMKSFTVLANTTATATGLNSLRFVYQTPSGEVCRSASSWHVCSCDGCDCAAGLVSFSIKHALQGNSKTQATGGNDREVAQLGEGITKPSQGSKQQASEDLGEGEAVG